MSYLFHNGDDEMQMRVEEYDPLGAGTIVCTDKVYIAKHGTAILTGGI